ncbi:hypothetical protein Bhyg_04444, partial [Pseudolycoriella hygida]
MCDKDSKQNEIITATAVVNKSPPKTVVKDNDNIDNPFSPISLESELAFHELFDGMLNGDPSRDNGFTVQNDNSVEENVQPTVSHEIPGAIMAEVKCSVHNSLLKAMLEIQASDSKERREIEARINFRLDVITKTLLNVSSQINCKNSLANPTENVRQAPEGDHCFTRKQSAMPTETPSENHIVKPRIVELRTQEHRTPRILEVDHSSSSNEKVIQSETYMVKPHTQENQLGSNILSGFESGFESESESLGQIDTPCVDEIVLSDPGLESDAESIPEPSMSKPVTEPKLIKLTQMGEKYRDTNNFMYSRNNVETSNCIYLCCMNNVKYNCPARAILKGDEATLTIYHTHAADKKHADKARFYDKLVEYIKLDPFERPAKIYLEAKRAMLELTDDPVDEGNLPAPKQTRGFIETRIKEHVPRLPKTIEEFHSWIGQEKYKRFAENSSKLPFYRGVWESAKGEKSVVFISETALKLVNTLNNVTLFMDGTFRALPYHLKFGQLYVINLIFKNRCYPLAYVLMEKRTFTAYDSIFSKLKLLMPSAEVVKLMTDYEAAARKALRINYPDARLSGIEMPVVFQSRGDLRTSETYLIININKKYYN